MVEGKELGYTARDGATTPDQVHIGPPEVRDRLVVIAAEVTGLFASPSG